MLRRKTAIRAGLETLYYSGVHHVARQFFAGAGAILPFHRVRPARADAFQPNRLLEITPEFLDEVLGALRSGGIDIVPIDQVRGRLVGRSPRRFVALTFDDGYRDNLEFAWPVLKRHEAPFAIYATSAFADGRGELWWLALEKAIARHEAIEVSIDGIERVFDCSTPEAKEESFRALHGILISCASEAELRRIVGEIAFGYGIDMAAQCREACMDWDELATLAADPLVTVGAHTATHAILSKLPADEARAEMVDGARAIAEKLGRAPVDFAYPVGGANAAGQREFALAAEAGFQTAVTTRPGVLFAAHARHMTALPRISVNGEFQRLRYLDVLLSGAATALVNGFRRIDAA